MKLIYDHINSIKTIQALHNEAIINLLKKITAKNKSNVFYKTVDMCIQYMQGMNYSDIRNFLSRAIYLSVNSYKTIGKRSATKY